MRRYLFILLFFLALAAPFLVRRAMTGGQPSMRTVSDTARLVVVTPHNQDIRREFARAFSEWHSRRFGRPVVIDYRVPGGTNDIKRQLEHHYRGYQREGKEPEAAFDVAWGGGDYFFAVELQPSDGLQILQPMDLDPALLAEAFPQPTLAGVKLYDSAKADVSDRTVPRPKWVGTCLSSFGIVYNADVYRSLGLAQPTTWHDLTNEKLFGLVALADPTHSGSAAVAYMVVVQRAMADAEEELFRKQPELSGLPQAEREKDAGYRAAVAQGWRRGMGELVLIAANARYFTDTASQVPNDVGNGEAAAGVAIDFLSRVYEQTVGPSRCRFVSPAGATAITPDPVAILAGVKGERLAVATRFVEFLLSREAQLLWIKKPGTPGGPRDRALRRPPVRQDVYADRTDWTDDINPFAEARGFNQRAEWTTLLGDTRMFWAAAWVDGREALRAAQARVLGVTDPARRASLVAALADVPVTLGDVEAYRAQRKQKEAAKDPTLEEWKARQRIAWGQKFREHYRAVAERAGQ
jgi:ABC-type Fe3+ transport system substrate-binding protein